MRTNISYYPKNSSDKYTFFGFLSDSNNPSTESCRTARFYIFRCNYIPELINVHLQGIGKLKPGITSRCN